MNIYSTPSRVYTKMTVVETKMTVIKNDSFPVTVIFAKKSPFSQNDREFSIKMAVRCTKMTVSLARSVFMKIFFNIDQFGGSYITLILVKNNGHFGVKLTVILVQK